MFRREPQEAIQRSDEHKRWLTMQSAHAEYKRTTEALEYLPPLSRDSTNDERLLRGVLQDRQRAAFERYLDARMEFLEFRLDAGERRGGRCLGLVRKRVPAAFGAASRLMFRKVRPILPVMAAATLVCAAALYFVHQQNRVRELGAARDELWAALNQARDQARMAGRSAIHEVDYTSPESAPRTQGTAARRPQPPLHKRASAKVVPTPAIPAQSIGARTYYSFSLEPSSQFKRIGPIQISLRSVDVQRSDVSLSIMSGPVKLDVRRLRLSQPLWIGDGQRQQPLALVADHIAGNRVYGRVIETRDKPDLRASRVKTGSQSNP